MTTSAPTGPEENAIKAESMEKPCEIRCTVRARKLYLGHVTIYGPPTHHHSLPICFIIKPRWHCISRRTQSTVCRRPGRTYGHLSLQHLVYLLYKSCPPISFHISLLANCSTSILCSPCRSPHKSPNVCHKIYYK